MVLNMGQQSSRQEIINMEVTDLRMRNWLCANMAFRETSKVLAIRVHRLISEIHKQMQRTAGAASACHSNCSHLNDSTASHPWCTVCDRWRKEILAVCDPQYKSRINWSRLNSSQWPVNPYEMGRTFIPRAHRLYYKSSEFHEDYRFTLSFIENCEEISVPRSLCERAWQCRGRVKRKNIRMRMGKQELEATISTFVELLTQPVFGDNDEMIKKLESLLITPEDVNEGCAVISRYFEGKA